MRARLLLPLLTTLAAGAGATTTHAAALGPGRLLAAQPAAPRSERQWYGAAMLVTDFAAIGLSYVIGLTPVVAFSSAAAYTFVSPLVHLGHERYGAALTSFLARVSAITMLGYGASRLGSYECSEPCERPPAGEWIAGGAITMLVASTVDIAVLSWARVPVTVAPAVDARRFGVTMTVTL